MSDKNFDDAFNTFVEGCERISHAYTDKNFPKIGHDIFRVRTGSRYMKVTTSRVPSEHGSVFCFVDKTSGDVLKPAGWSGPAKHARGNIFDDNNGLGSIGPYGPAYLRR